MNFVRRWLSPSTRVPAPEAAMLISTSGRGGLESVLLHQARKLGRPGRASLLGVGESPVLLDVHAKRVRLDLQLGVEANELVLATDLDAALLLLLDRVHHLTEARGQRRDRLGDSAIPPMLPTTVCSPLWTTWGTRAIRCSPRSLRR
jgi:hypothetical protein